MSAEKVHHQGKSNELCHGGAAAKAENQAAVEATDHGLFDFVGKKKEKMKYEGEKLYRSSSSSSSSSEEELSESGEKKKKKKASKEKMSDDKIEGKKGCLDKIKGMLTDDKKAEEKVVASPPPMPAAAPVATE